MFALHDQKPTMSQEENQLKILRQKIECLVVNDVVDDFRDELINCLKVANRPQQTINLARSVVEKLTKRVLTDIGKKPPDMLDPCIRMLEKPEVMSRGLVSQQIISLLHTARIWGNKATHGDMRVKPTLDTVVWLLGIVIEVVEWYFTDFERGPKISPLYKDLTQEDNLNWQNYLNYLSEINFHEASELFKQLDQMVDTGVSFVFLLQESCSMCGDLCIVKLKKFLAEKTKIQHHIKRPYLIDFSRFIPEPTPYDLLNHLAKEVSKTHYQDLGKSPQILVEKICHSLRNSDVVFFELKNVHFLKTEQSTILKWFIEEFWKIVESELLKISEHYSYIKFICVITTDEYQLQFENPKLTQLPLETWQKDEIAEWLKAYSIVPKKEAEKLASTIYGSSARGIPQMVREQLHSHLPTYK